jgi:protein AroM
MTRFGVILPYRINDELSSFVKENLETEAELQVCGTQDGLSDEELCVLAKGNPLNPFSDLLADGTTVYLNGDDIMQRACKMAAQFQAEGMDATLMCCTLPWPALEAMPNVVCPSRILEHMTLALPPRDGTIGVLQPLEDVMAEEIVHWKALGPRVVSACGASPVPGFPDAAGDEELAAAARSLVAQGADLIVMDCMGYVRHNRDVVAKATGKPTLLPMSLSGKVLDEVYR